MKFLKLPLYNKHQRKHKNLECLKIPCLYSDCHAEFTSCDIFLRHCYLRHSHQYMKLKLNCKMQDCTYMTDNRDALNKHVKSHLINAKNGISCPYAACSSSNTIYYNARSYTVHVCRSHWEEDSNEDGPVEKIVALQNESVQNVFAGHGQPMDTGVGEAADAAERQEGAVKAHLLNNACIIQPFGESNMLEATRTLADKCLTLSTRHYVTEPLLQKVISKTSHAFQICKDFFFFSE